MSLKDLNVVVTGGRRGLGLGVVEALVAQSAHVTVVARDTAALAAVHARLGVATVSADVTDAHAARRTLTDVRPQILVLNAGATPHMGRLDQLSWADFSVAWETDVKAGLHWLQAALTLPLAPGSRVLVVSSGAAVNGSPLSGGYAAARVRREGACRAGRSALRRGPRLRAQRRYRHHDPRRRGGLSTTPLSPSLERDRDREAQLLALAAAALAVSNRPQPRARSAAQPGGAPGRADGRCRGPCRPGQPRPDGDADAEWVLAV